VNAALRNRLPPARPCLASESSVTVWPRIRPARQNRRKHGGWFCTSHPHNRGGCVKTTTSLTDTLADRLEASRAVAIGRAVGCFGRSPPSEFAAVGYAAARQLAERAREFKGLATAPSSTPYCPPSGSLGPRYCAQRHHQVVGERPTSGNACRTACHSAVLAFRPRGKDCLTCCLNSFRRSRGSSFQSKP
jgi:hypothetical protein